jgi:hypothetical protein
VKLPFAAALLVCAACSSRPSMTHCEQAIDHMIDIFLAPQTPGNQPVPADALKEAEAWKAIVKQKDPGRAVMIDTCRERMTDKVASCILEARDETSLAACFG